MYHCRITDIVKALICASCLLSFSFICEAQPYTISDETYSTSVVWSGANGLNTLNGSSTQITYYKGNTYIVYITGTTSLARPKLVKITEAGVITETYLEPSDYRVLHDGHHYFAIGVDEAGYIHIAGDMHNYPNANTGHLPARHQNGTVMYWKSDNPEDITSFTWLGDVAGQCPQGYGHSYPAFFNDHHGRLFYTARSWSTMGYSAGKKDCASLCRYDVDTSLWEDMGEEPPGSNFTLPMAFWENNAEGGTSSYARVRARGTADLSNRIHMISALLNSNDYASGGHINTDLVYMRSDDSAETFTKADDTPVQLPGRVEAGSNQADVIFSHDYIVTDCGVAFDRNQNPVAIAKNKNSNDCAIFSYDPSSGWTNHGWTTTAPKSTAIFSDAMGVLTVPVKGPGRFIRFWDWNEATNYITNAPGGWAFHSVDKMYLQKTGNIQWVYNTFNSNNDYQLRRTVINRPAEPEILLEGNAQEISNNSAASIVHDTDFGDVAVGSVLSKTYTIKNVGTTELRVFNVTVEGAGFSVVNQPVDLIAANDEVTFQIEFSPSAEENYEAVVSFGCSDLDESRFYFSIAGAGTTILPVELALFNVEELVNGEVELRWETISEINNSFFEIEKSATGTTWTKVGRVEGGVNTTASSSYNWIDERPFVGVNYYRLKQVDIDGSFEYSPIKSIFINREKTVVIYPNPTSGVINIEVENKEGQKVELYDMEGKFLQEVNSSQVDLGHLPDGLYLLKVDLKSNEQSSYFKVIKF